MRILICGGGTAGHIYPGLALAKELKRQTKNVEMLFLGTPDGLEATIVPQTGFSLKTIKVKGFKRNLSPQNVLSLAALLTGLYGAFKIVREFQPSVVVGLGGYVSVPGVLTALATGIPTLIHEQNAIPGLANRFLGKFADVVALSYPSSEVYFPARQKKVITGNPVREETRGVNRESGIKALHLDPSRKTLLVFGGSRGAKKINDVMVASYQLFRSRGDLQILHITGSTHYSSIVSAVEALRKKEDKIIYRIYPYVDNIGFFYAAADLALSRAGAMAIAELAANGVASLLIPYPFATEAHQEKNAQYVEKMKAAVVMTERDLTPDLVYKEVSRIIANDKVLESMKEAAKGLDNPEAARILAKLVLEIGSRRVG